MFRYIAVLLAAVAALVPATSGALELEPCRISAGPAFPSMKANCGTLERPENPDDPESAMIELRVAVVPALNLEPEPDPVVLLAGGPGQGAVQFYAFYSHAFEPVRRNRDILLVDQRGTGESSRMDCEVDDMLHADEASLEQMRELTRECLEALPHDPRYFTTSIAVRDLDVVREALGYPELNLYGVSYGTRVAQHFAKRFPEATRTIVLDGVVPPGLPLGPDIAIEAQRALDNIFARCAADEGCAERFPDIAETFDSLKSRLTASPVNVSVPNPTTGAVETFSFGRNELAAGIRLLAYDPNSIAMIPLLISEAHDGNYEPIAAQYLMTMMSLSDMLALGMHNSIMCTEDAPWYDGMEIDRAALEATYMGAVQVDALAAICEEWPAGPIDDDFREPLSTDIPTLLLSGDADPITPPSYADRAARNLQRAWLLTGERQGHGQIAVGCMPRIFDRFVTNRELADGDADCFDSAFVMPFFLDFSGPRP
ncbi:MAG: alpha/beta fold hydrolase [Woeseiaceae bacterium]|nr:alpha/beta fold hydrolase [Woeseiaceae bacterium]